MTDPRDQPLTPEQRIALLERTLREIVALADQHPHSVWLRHARTLAKVALEG